MRSNQPVAERTELANTGEDVLTQSDPIRSEGYILRRKFSIREIRPSSVMGAELWIREKT